MDKILRETTNLCVEIMNSKRQVNGETWSRGTKRRFSFEAKVKLNHSIVFNWGNFGEQYNPSPPPPPSIQSRGVDCFLQVAQTVAQHCMEGVGEGKLNFPFLIWQIVRKVVWGKVSQLILSPILPPPWSILDCCQKFYVNLSALPLPSATWLSLR